MSHLLRSLLFSLLLNSCIGNNTGPVCEAPSDYNHPLPQEELEGRWSLHYHSLHEYEQTENTITTSWLDFHFINAHVQVRQIIAQNHYVRIETHEMQITKKNNSYTLTAMDYNYTFTIYPVSDHKILHDGEDGLSLFSRNNETSGFTDEDFKILPQCLWHKVVNTNFSSTYDPEYSAKTCQDYKPISDSAVVSEIIGKKTLVLSAYTSKTLANRDQKLKYALQNYDIEGDKLKGNYVIGIQGSILRHQLAIHLEAEHGVLTVRDSINNFSINIYSTDDKCVSLASSAQKDNNFTRFLLIYCGSEEPISIMDIHKFIQHAICQNFPYIIIRRASANLALSCEDVAHTVGHIAVEKLVGRWHYVASASNVALSRESEGQWVQIEVQDGEINLTDSFRFSKIPGGVPVKVSGDTWTVLTDLAKKVTVTFYDVGEDSFLANIYVECEWGTYNSLNLFSKSGNTDAAQIARFKLAASCLSLPVLFTK